MLGRVLPSFPKSEERSVGRLCRLASQTAGPSSLVYCCERNTSDTITDPLAAIYLLILHPGRDVGG